MIVEKEYFLKERSQWFINNFGFFELFYASSLLYAWVLQAELYRVRKEFEKAEPLYLDAINILEEAFGKDDIR